MGKETIQIRPYVEERGGKTPQTVGDYPRRNEEQHIQDAATARMRDAITTELRPQKPEESEITFP